MTTRHSYTIAERPPPPLHTQLCRTPDSSDLGLRRAVPRRLSRSWGSSSHLEIGAARVAQRALLLAIVALVAGALFASISNAGAAIRRARSIGRPLWLILADPVAGDVRHQLHHGLPGASFAMASEADHQARGPAARAHDDPSPSQQAASDRAPEPERCEDEACRPPRARPRTEIAFLLITDAPDLVRARPAWRRARETICSTQPPGRP